MIKIKMLAGFLIALSLLALAGIATAEEKSNVDLTQIAVDKMGDTNQEARISDFDFAGSQQLGYSQDGTVTQAVFYDNVGNGTILQWGEAGDMGAPKERDYYVDKVGDEGWSTNNFVGNGMVNQTINIRNSEKIFMQQIVGGVKNILYPEMNKQQQRAYDEGSGSWYFCGPKGKPGCAERIANRIIAGKATARDYYMLDDLEWNYNAFPPEDLKLHVVMTKWNVTRNNDTLIITFKAQNFGRQPYNSTLMVDMMPKETINIDGGNFQKIEAKGNVVELKAEDNLESDIKIAEKQVIEVGTYFVPSMYAVEKKIEVPLNGMKLKGLEMRMIST